MPREGSQLPASNPTGGVIQLVNPKTGTKATMTEATMDMVANKMGLSREAAAVELLDTSRGGYRAAKSHAQAAREEEHPHGDEGKSSGDQDDTGNEAGTPSAEGSPQ